MGHYYWVAAYHYLTPFYSPCINGECVPGSSSLGHWFPAVPPIIPYAVISLPFVLGFRLSCYYYRRAYYRAFWRAPAACAVREPHAKYTGETRFPLIMQNLHRYFFYAVILISILNTYDAVQAFHGKDGGVGFGLGTLIIVVNVILLWGYTLSCHWCRHITGGRLKNFSKHPVRYCGLDSDLQAERQAHAAGVDDPGHADADRPVHHARRQRCHQRPAILQLRRQLA